MSYTNGRPASGELKRFRERLELAHKDARELGINLALPMQAWFAQRSGIDPASVSRMLGGHEPVHGYAKGALSLLEDVNELTARARKAENNITVVLLEDAAEAAAQEAAKLKETIGRLRELCEHPSVNGERVLEEAGR